MTETKKLFHPSADWEINNGSCLQEHVQLKSSYTIEEKKKSLSTT